MTGAEFNKRFNTTKFAVETDVYGLPINGWNVPAFTIETKDGQVQFSIGSFKISEDDDLILASEMHTVPIDDYEPNNNSRIFEGLAEKLVAYLEQLSG